MVVNAYIWYNVCRLRRSSVHIDLPGPRPTTGMHQNVCEHMCLCRHRFRSKQRLFYESVSLCKRASPELCFLKVRGYNNNILYSESSDSLCLWLCICLYLAPSHSLSIYDIIRTHIFGAQAWSNGEMPPSVIDLFHLQYIPRNMHTVLLCFALLWLCNRS